MKKSIFTGSMMVLMLAAASFAHDAWVTGDSAGFKVVFGHEKVEGYNPSKVKETSAYDAGGNKLTLKPVTADSGVSLKIEGKPSYITLVFDNGFYTRTTEGSKSISKKGIKDYISSSHAVKYSKSVFAWSEKLLKPVGQKIEIVPSVNPLTLKKDDTLAVTVYYENKPLAGAAVSTAGSHKEKTKTDGQGKARVKLDESGKGMIVASWKVPLENNPDADTLSLSGALFIDMR